jgi:hypothetical protein
LDADTAEWVISVLCDLATEGNGMIFEAVTNASAKVKGETALAYLAKRLLERLPVRDWSQRGAAYNLLDDILRRRKSDLRSLPSTACETWLLAASDR